MKPCESGRFRLDGGEYEDENRFALASEEWRCYIAPGLLSAQQQARRTNPHYSGGLWSRRVCQAETEILLNTCSPHSYLVCIKRSWLPSQRKGKWIMC